MASHRPKGRGFEFRVNANGIKRSKTFTNLVDGRRWAKLTEAELLKRPRVPNSPSLILREALERYRREVTAKHKGTRQETGRLELLAREPFVDFPLADITPEIIRAYRDRLAQQGNGSNTIRVKLALLSAIYRHALAEWGYKGENPVQQVRKPAPGKGRQRRITADEEARLIAAAQGAQNPSLAPLIAFALETGMRRSELLQLAWEDILENEGIVRLKDTKNGQPRWIPLSERAKRILHAQRDRVEARPFHVLKAQGLSCCYRYRPMHRAVSQSGRFRIRCVSRSIPCSIRCRSTSRS